MRPVLAGQSNVAENWFQFFVVHYSEGQDGAGAGGSLEFFWKPVGETSVTFPQFGNGADNPDQFGNGGIVSARGFSVAIVEPEAGATGLLFMMALAGIGFLPLCKTLTTNTTARNYGRSSPTV